MAAVPRVGHVAATLGIEVAVQADARPLAQIGSGRGRARVLNPRAIGEALQDAQVPRGHGEDQVPLPQLPGADLARAMVGHGVSGVAQDAGGAAVDGVAGFLVGDAGAVDDDVHAGARGGLVEDRVGHRGAADVAGAHHQDAAGAGHGRFRSFGGGYEAGAGAPRGASAWLRVAGRRRGGDRDEAGAGSQGAAASDRAAQGRAVGARVLRGGGAAGEPQRSVR